MFNRNPMGLSARLALGFGLVVVLCALASAIGVWQLRDQAARLELLAHNRLEKIEQLAELKANFAEGGRATRDFLFDPDGPSRQTELEVIKGLRARNDALMRQLDQSMHLPRSRALLQALTEARKAYGGDSARIVELAAGSRVVEARFLLYGDFRRSQKALYAAVDALSQYQQSLAVQTATDGQARAEEASASLLAFAVLAVLGSVAVGTLIVRGVSRALGAEPWEVSAVVSRVADGDLSSPVPVRPGDRTSTMAAVARMQQALQRTVGQVMCSAESVAGASSQIAQGNQDLSQRTQEQASALVQTTLAMDAMQTAVVANTARAHEAHALATEASDLAGRGGRVINEFVLAIQAMNQNGQRIGEITSLIDTLAFQTNILALNAAVEAARAGEQGRGFAVVAGEVRSLAQRSAEAARQITEVIAASTAEVGRSSEHVLQAQRLFQEIVGAIGALSARVADINEATRVQGDDIGHVGQAVIQLDAATQQNATLVEESAAAADSLRHQASRLVEVVAQFQVAAPEAAAATGAAR